jgi:spore coat polysaccharide biosynthesis predicted glycosyltransferase SpsG
MNEQSAVLIQCNANAESGLGHFSRCFSLARWMLAEKKDMKVVFCGDFNAYAASLLNRFEIPYHQVADSFRSNAPKTLQLATDYDTLMIDSYHLDQNYIDRVTSGKWRTVFLDDFHTANLRSADLVVNYTLMGEKIEYGCANVALGTRFFVVKPELVAVRKKRMCHFGEKIKNVYIFLSGMDGMQTQIQRLLSLLDQHLKDVIFHCVVSDADAKKLKFQKSQRNTLKLTTFSYAMESFLADADVVISGAGLTKYESAYCCVPNATLSLNSGQRQDTEDFTRELLSFDLGSIDDTSQSSMDKNLSAFLKNHNLRKSMHENAKKRFETNSSSRLVQRVLALL